MRNQKRSYSIPEVGATMPWLSSSVRRRFLESSAGRKSVPVGQEHILTNSCKQSQNNVSTNCPFSLHVSYHSHSEHLSLARDTMMSPCPHHWIKKICCSLAGSHKQLPSSEVVAAEGSKANLGQHGGDCSSVFKFALQIPN